jgi:hypothetical protein
LFNHEEQPASSFVTMGLACSCTLTQHYFPCEMSSQAISSSHESSSLLPQHDEGLPATPDPIPGNVNVTTNLADVTLEWHHTKG